MRVLLAEGKKARGGRLRRRRSACGPAPARVHQLAAGALRVRPGPEAEDRRRARRRRRSPGRSSSCPGATPLKLGGKRVPRASSRSSVEGEARDRQRRRRSRRTSYGVVPRRGAVRLAGRGAEGAGRRRALVRARRAQDRRVRPLRRRAQPGLRRRRAPRSRRRRAAVDATAGQVLLYEGKVADDVLLLDLAAAGRRASPTCGRASPSAVPRLGRPTRTTPPRRTTAGGPFAFTSARLASSAQASRAGCSTCARRVNASGRVEQRDASSAARARRASAATEVRDAARPALDLVPRRRARRSTRPTAPVELRRRGAGSTGVARGVAQRDARAARRRPAPGQPAARVTPARGRRVAVAVKPLATTDVPAGRAATRPHARRCASSVAPRVRLAPPTDADGAARRRSGPSCRARRSHVQRLAGSSWRAAGVRGRRRERRVRGAARARRRGPTARASRRAAASRRALARARRRRRVTRLAPARLRRRARSRPRRRTRRASPSGSRAGAVAEAVAAVERARRRGSTRAARAARRVVVESPSAAALAPRAGRRLRRARSTRRAGSRSRPTTRSRPRQWYLDHVRAFDAWAEPPPLAGPRGRGHRLRDRRRATPSSRTGSPARRSFVGGSARDGPAGPRHVRRRADRGRRRTTATASRASRSARSCSSRRSSAATAPISLEAEADGDPLGGRQRRARDQPQPRRRARPAQPGRDTFSPLEAARDRVRGRHAASSSSPPSGTPTRRRAGRGRSRATRRRSRTCSASSALARDGSVPKFSDRDRIFNDLAAPGAGDRLDLPARAHRSRRPVREQGYSRLRPRASTGAAEGTSFAAPQVCARPLRWCCACGPT